MKQWFSHTLRVCGLAALALLPTMHVDAVLASVKSLGMAGVGVAFPQDSLSSVFNPALGVDIGNRIDVGGIWVQTHGQMDIVGNSPVTLAPGLTIPSNNGRYKANRHNNIVSPDLGINYMVCGSCDFSIGLILYNKDYLQVGYDRGIPLFGGPSAVNPLGTGSRVGLEGIQEAISAVSSMRFDNHAFGIAVQLGIQRFKVRGVENFDRALFSQAPSHVTNRNGDYSYGLGVVLGYTWQPMQGFRLGLAYESRTHMTRLHNYSGFLENKGRLDYPERWSAGVDIELMPCLNFDVDFQWVRRKGVGSLGNNAPPTFASLANNKLGSKGGPGFGWKNQPFVRTGLAYQLPQYDLVLRTGYRWTQQPIHSADTIVNALTLDLVENVFCVGATWTPVCGNEISVFYGHGFRKKLHGTKQLEGPLGGGVANIQSSVDVAGLEYGILF